MSQKRNKIIVLIIVVVVLSVILYSLFKGNLFKLAKSYIYHKYFAECLQISKDQSSLGDKKVFLCKKDKHKNVEMVEDYNKLVLQNTDVVVMIFDINKILTEYNNLNTSEETEYCLIYSNKNAMIFSPDRTKPLPYVKSFLLSLPEGGSLCTTLKNTGVIGIVFGNKQHFSSFESDIYMPQPPKEGNTEDRYEMLPVFNLILH